MKISDNNSYFLVGKMYGLENFMYYYPLTKLSDKIIFNFSAAKEEPADQNLFSYRL